MLIVDTGDGPRGGESPAGSSPRVATAGEATRVPARPRRGVCAGEARAGTRVTRDRERALARCFEKPKGTTKTQTRENVTNRRTRVRGELLVHHAGVRRGERGVGQLHAVARGRHGEEILGREVVHRQDRVGVSAGQTHASQDHPQQDQRGAIRPSRTAPRSSRGHHDANRGYHRAGRGRDASTLQRRFSCVAVRGALRRAAPLLRATTGMTSSDEKKVPNVVTQATGRTRSDAEIYMYSYDVS